MNDAICETSQERTREVLMKRFLFAQADKELHASRAGLALKEIQHEAKTKLFVLWQR